MQPIKQNKNNSMKDINNKSVSFYFNFPIFSAILLIFVCFDIFLIAREIVTSQSKTQSIRYLVMVCLQKSVLIKLLWICKNTFYTIINQKVSVDPFTITKKKTEQLLRIANNNKKSNKLTRKTFLSTQKTPKSKLFQWPVKSNWKNVEKENKFTWRHIKSVERELTISWLIVL